MENAMPDSFRKSKSIRLKVIERLKASSTGLKFQITALTDIVFLLLIFFIATTRFRPNEGELPLGLPSAQFSGVGAAVLVDPLKVDLDTTAGNMIIRYGEKEVILENANIDAMNSVAGEFELYYKSQNRTATDPLELECGENLTWDHLAKFCNIMYGLGIENITFLMD